MQPVNILSVLLLIIFKVSFIISFELCTSVCIPVLNPLLMKEYMYVDIDLISFSKLINVVSNTNCC